MIELGKSSGPMGVANWIASLLIVSFFCPLASAFAIAPPVNDIVLTITSTSVDMILNYTAPSTAACSPPEVSESPSYSPLVNDVNPVLFSQAGRELGVGTTARQFVVGTRQQLHGTVALVALDGKTYPRTLHVNTTHYIRLTCGSHTGTASFNTRNPPIGKTSAEPRPIVAAGSYGLPTLDANDRTQTLLDLQTGYKLCKLSITSDNNALSGTDSAEFTESGSEWIWGQSTVDDNSGNHYYLATFPTKQGFTRLYDFNTATCVGHFLGHLVMPGGTLTGFSTNHYVGFVSSSLGPTPTNNYSIFVDDGGDSHAIRCSLPASGNSYYAADIGAGLNASCTWSDLTSSSTLSAQMFAFDATYDKTKFAGFGNQWVQGHYLMFAANRGQQNSYAWVGVFDLNTNTVVAMFPGYNRASTLSGNFRWCGYHTPQANLGSNIMSWESHDLVDSSGVGEGPYTTTLTTSMDLTTLTADFASMTPTAPFADTTLYAFQVGDRVRIDENEQLNIAAISGLHVTFAPPRGGGGFTAHTHAIGAVVRASCSATDPNDFTEASIAAWDFINDPHGNDITGVFLQQINDGVNGHQGWANGRKIGTGWKGCAVSTVVPCAPTMTLTNSPAFNSVTKNAGGNAWMSHSAPPHQSLASTTEKQWGMDFNLPYNDPDMNGYTLTNVTGTLWKYTNSYVFDLKSLPIEGFAGTHKLLDISSPATGIQILGTSADNHKICFAYLPGECRPGSAAGDIFINAPSIGAGSTCPVSLTGTSADDDKLCLFNTPAIGQNLQQIGIIANTTTFKYTRSISQGLQPYKLVHVGNNGQATPDGLFAAFAVDGLDGFRNVWVASLPPYPAYDGIDRNTFQQTHITVSSVGGATKAYIRGGYDTNLFCKERAERCAFGAGVSPYAFESSDTLTPTACTLGCDIPLAVLPDHVMYYQVVWLSAGGSIVQTGAIQAVVDNGSGGSGPLVPGTVLNSKLGGRVTVQ